MSSTSSSNHRETSKGVLSIEEQLDLLKQNQDYSDALSQTAGLIQSMREQKNCLLEALTTLRNRFDHNDSTVADIWRDLAEAVFQERGVDLSADQIEEYISRYADNPGGVTPEPTNLIPVSRLLGITRLSQFLSSRKALTFFKKDSFFNNGLPTSDAMLYSFFFITFPLICAFEGALMRFNTTTSPLYRNVKETSKTLSLLTAALFSLRYGSPMADLTLYGAADFSHTPTRLKIYNYNSANLIVESPLYEQDLIGPVEYNNLRFITYRGANHQDSHVDFGDLALSSTLWYNLMDVINWSSISVTASDSEFMTGILTQLRTTFSSITYIPQVLGKNMGQIISLQTFLAHLAPAIALSSAGLIFTSNINKSGSDPVENHTEMLRSMVRAFADDLRGWFVFDDILETRYANLHPFNPSTDGGINHAAFSETPLPFSIVQPIMVTNRSAAQGGSSVFVQTCSLTFHEGTLYIAPFTIMGLAKLTTNNEVISFVAATQYSFENRSLVHKSTPGYILPHLSGDFVCPVSSCQSEDAYISYLNGTVGQVQSAPCYIHNFNRAQDVSASNMKVYWINVDDQKIGVGFSWRGRLQDLQTVGNGGFPEPVTFFDSVAYSEFIDRALEYYYETGYFVWEHFSHNVRFESSYTSTGVSNGTTKDITVSYFSTSGSSGYVFTDTSKPGDVRVRFEDSIVQITVVGDDQIMVRVVKDKPADFFARPADFKSHYSEATSDYFDPFSNSRFPDTLTALLLGLTKGDKLYYYYERDTDTILSSKSSVVHTSSEVTGYVRGGGIDILGSIPVIIAESEDGQHYMKLYPDVVVPIN